VSTYPPLDAASVRYELERHSGWAISRWRVVGRWADERAARQRYRIAAAVLRQGGVRLRRRARDRRGLDVERPLELESRWIPITLSRSLFPRPRAR
jgi:hypothetical protein